jgi:hypothetical protein
VDYIKVDDLSSPYHTGEIEMIRKALDKCERPIVFSTSPGPTPVAQAAHISAHANMWRISGDFWDNWRKLRDQFGLLARWQAYGGIGHWPDADMIPIGHLCIRSKLGGNDHQTHFTPEEQRTLMSLWSLAPSPLMFGGNLPDNDELTLLLLTNDEVLALNQDALGRKATFVATNDTSRVFARDLSGGVKAAGLFNLGGTPTNVIASWTALQLSGSQKVRDLWQHKDLGSYENEFSASLEPHGVVLVRFSPAR